MEREKNEKGYIKTFLEVSELFLNNFYIKNPLKIFKDEKKSLSITPVSLCYDEYELLFYLHVHNG